MSAYVIFMREGEVHDPEAMEAYRAAPRPPIADKIKPLAVYGKMQALEGAAPDGVVILEFPSVDEARAWYDSPEYQQAVPHRLRAAHYRGFIVEGYAPA